MLVALALGLAAAPFGSFCDETPTPGPSTSHGAPADGSVDGAVRFVDTAHARVMPRRHVARCLSWGTDRIVRAIAHAGDVVAAEHANSPPLGVGNIGRARGGPIREFSRSHNAGRDADLAFYLLDDDDRPVPADDLVVLDANLRGFTADRVHVHLDVPRTWTLCRALLEDALVDVRFLFVATPIKRALLAEGRRERASAQTLARAADVLHQPTDAPPHDDHVHLRIRCTADERAHGCTD